MSLRNPPKGDVQPDLFIPYLSDLPLRDQHQVMERPFFALGKRKRLIPIDYTSPNGKYWIRVEGHQAHGMATIWDADILIWAASVLTEMKNRGVNDLPRTLHVHPYALLKAMRRETKGGDHYERLRAALDRLRHTAIKTNINVEGRKKTASFGWLEGWREVINETTKESEGLTITLSEWMYEAIVKDGGVIQIHQDYFLLKGGFERWLYRVARKHAGDAGPDGWCCALTTLHQKSGSDSPLRRFKFEMHKIVEADGLPEIHLEWIERTAGRDHEVRMVRRDQLPQDHPAFRLTPRRARKRPRKVGLLGTPPV